MIASAVRRCGMHEEKQRSAEDDDDAGDARGSGKNKKHKAERVFRYTFMDPDDNRLSKPMFVIAYEELYNSSLTEVTAIRIWKFVFDSTHSDSHLWRVVMDESNKTEHQGGLAHQKNSSRHRGALDDQKLHRIMSRPGAGRGGQIGGNGLEDFAGTQYPRITTECRLATALRSAAGKSIHNDGMPGCRWQDLPAGCMNQRIECDNTGLGGLHPFGPEYQFNAQRRDALAAWLCDFDQQPLDVHADFTDPSKYFAPVDTSVMHRRSFRPCPASVQQRGFFFCIDPSRTNIFQLRIPRPLFGSIMPGQHLLDLFSAERCNRDVAPCASVASVADQFVNFMTARDAEQMSMERSALECFTFDAIGLTEEQRSSLRHYGDGAGPRDAFVVEPPNRMRELQQQTRRVVSELIEPWCARRTRMLANARTDDEADAVLAETRGMHHRVMRDLISLHLNRIEVAFQSKAQRETIPKGYCAMYDYLHETSSKLGTASMAWAFNNELTADDISPFAEMVLHQGDFFETSCFIDGRDRRIMDDLFLHFFEQYADTTFLLLLCGSKGNGKSLRTERIAAVFPPNWVTMGGPASSKAGMNGDFGPTNGKNVIYDEMMAELCDSDGTDRLEYWKQISTKREYTYDRTMSVTAADGTESFRTVRLRTPHYETHCICTNYGMAFTKDGNPSDTKFAMIDRSIAHLVRSVGKTARDDNEFHRNLSTPAVQQELLKLRMFISLVGATKLVTMGVPAFQPNLAYANKVFDHLDETVIVGEYNLPARSPRKCLKRAENLRTMCAMRAVGEVFMYKQTCVSWSCGALDADGNAQPFKFALLYDVVRQLHPTPEQIFMAWSQALDYNIGTSAHSFAAMTAVTEAFRVPPWETMKKTPTGLANPPHNANIGPPEASDQDYTNTQANIRDWEQSESGCLNILPEPTFSFTNTVRTESERELKSYERRRRATSKYRHMCAEGRNSERIMSNPVKTIDAIMHGAGMPLDVDDATPGGEDAMRDDEDDANYMPLYSSLIMATAVQNLSLYHDKALEAWLKGEVAQVPPGSGSTGTKQGVQFRKKTKFTDGTTEWDLAWMSYDKPCQRLSQFVTKMLVSNDTARMFDIPANAMRDLVFLLTTKDNSRRITEEPKLPLSMRAVNVFETQAGERPADSCEAVKPKRPQSRSVAKQFDDRMQRHPYSLIVHNEEQRMIDDMVNEGRLPAMMPHMSNNTTTASPVRLVDDLDADKGAEMKRLELNSAAAFEHGAMVYESVFRCQLQPGMANVQEKFCDNMQGPAPFKQLVKHPETGVEEEIQLPYAYDCVSISIALDVMRRFYDPFRADYLSSFKENLKTDHGLTMRIQQDQLPHMCLRFVGTQEKDKNRRLLSMLPPSERHPAFEDVEAGDHFNVGCVRHDTRATVSLGLGHIACDAEVAAFQKSRAGTRCMSGVSGPLMSAVTWLQHAATTLMERGMAYGLDDQVCVAAADAQYGLRLRQAELVSMQIDKALEITKKRLVDSVGEIQQDANSYVDHLRVIKQRHDLIEANKDNLPSGISEEHMRKYGVLGITQERIKLTYHNYDDTADETTDSGQQGRANGRGVADMSALLGAASGAGRRGAARGRS